VPASRTASNRRAVTLLLVRHGETDWNRDRIWQGHSGPGLNDAGREQAEELAAQLDTVDAIYASDARRAVETAEILSASLDRDITTDVRLREVGFGEWEGLTRKEIDHRYADAVTRWEAEQQPPPAFVEPDDAMAARVLEALGAISDRHPRGRVLVVTSGGPIRAVQAHVRGIDQAMLARRMVPTVKNCALVKVVIREGIFEEARPGRPPPSAASL